MTTPNSLVRQIERLDAWLTAARARSNRISWLRAAVAAIAFVVALPVGRQFGAEAGAAALVPGILLFIGVVAWHRRVDRWVDTLTVWRELRADSLARLSLDWENIPGPAPIHLQARRGLALDLDLTGLHSVHQLLDTTVSRAGSQLLGDWLVQPRPEIKEVEKRQNLARELMGWERLRYRFRLTFLLLLQDRFEAARLQWWIQTQIPTRRVAWSLAIGALLVAVNLLAFALYFWAGGPPVWVATAGIYLLFLFFSQPVLAETFEALREMDAETERLAALLELLERQDYAGRPNLAKLCEPFTGRERSPSSELRRVKWVTVLVSLRSNLLLGLILNLILPWDLLAAFLAGRAHAALADVLPLWIERVHALDGLIALANYGALNPTCTFPCIRTDASPALAASSLGHPLIPAASRVTNDFQIGAIGELALITGSNMAGKSTFLKTVGVNLALAFAGAPVCADRFETRLFRLHTCIRITDSVTDGFSYFYAEVKCLKWLLQELREEDPRPLLYLVDEIFRGTNNRERLIGSRAYVRAILGANGVGLLSTHDLELVNLAAESTRIHNYHFSDSVMDGKLTFDYRLRPGPSPTTNALKIMALEGLPME